MNDFGIYLSYNNQEEGFRIPVNPETVEVQESGSGKTYDIVGLGGATEETRAGEINVIKNPHLREISFSSIFPAHSYPFIVSRIVLHPMQYVAFIRKWMSAKRPIRFVFTGHAFDLSGKQVQGMSIPASVEKFEWKEVAGSPGDIEYSLSLKEYVFYSARRIFPKTDSAGAQVLIQEPPIRPDERTRPLLYTVQEGENLWHVARKTLGDETRSGEIQALNDIPDDKLFDLPAGLILEIPQT